MKILLLLTDVARGNGGIAAFNQSFVQALSRVTGSLKWDVKLLVLNDAVVPIVSSRWAVQTFSGKRFAFGVAVLSAGLNADLVIVGHVHLSGFLLTMPRAHRWLIAHGVEVWRPLSMFRRLAVRSMEKILVVSRFTQNKMESAGLAPPWVFEWMPNTLPAAVPQSEFFPRQQLNLPNGRMLLCVSRLDPGDAYKRIDLIIESLQKLRLRFPDVFLAIVGQGKDLARLKQLAQEKEVSRQVYFCGFVEEGDLPSYYATCDIFVLPSVEEGFGIVYLEAMAHQKPCVGARAGAVPEVILNGQTGWLAEPNDLMTLESALVKLLENPVQAQAMGVAGRDRLNELFAFEHFQQRLYQAFHFEDSASIIQKAA